MRSFKNALRGAALAAACLVLFSGSPASAAEKIVFADMTWDSIMVQNRIVAFIIDHAYGYDSDYMPGATPVVVQGLVTGDVDVDMESWTQNIQEVYDKAVASGKILDLGPSLATTSQGWFVPRFVVEGDQERGIEPMAPGLKTVFDLPEYWELFRDPEQPDKGRYYNAMAGWAITEKLSQKLKSYGLDEYYNDFIPGSDAALSGSLAAAYERGKPWFGYYWAPTWVLGKYDMIMLEEPPYDPQVWEETRACAIPPTDVNILVNTTLTDRAPEVLALLQKYEISEDNANKFLFYMKDTQANAMQTAQWFLKNNEDVWTKWLPAKDVAKVKKALQ